MMIIFCILSDVLFFQRRSATFGNNWVAADQTETDHRIMLMDHSRKLSDTRTLNRFSWFAKICIHRPIVVERSNNGRYQAIRTQDQRKKKQTELNRTTRRIMKATTTTNKNKNDLRSSQKTVNDWVFFALIHGYWVIVVVGLSSRGDYPHYAQRAHTQHTQNSHAGARLAQNLFQLLTHFLLLYVCSVVVCAGFIRRPTIPNSKHNGNIKMCRDWLEELWLYVIIPNLGFCLPLAVLLLFSVVVVRNIKYSIFHLPFHR